MEFRDYDTLIAIAEEGKLEAAARRLDVTGAAISQRLSRMERKAGERFVVRTKPVSLTKAGEVQVQVGRQIRMILKQNWNSVGTSGKEVRVAMHHDSLAVWFLPVIAAVTGRTRRAVEIIFADHSETRSLLSTGRVVAAISSEAEPVAGCVAAELGRLDYALVVSSEFSSEEAWRSLPVLFFDRQDSRTPTIISQLGLSDAARGYVPSIHDLRAAVIHGAGIAVIPYPLVEADLKEGVLISLLPYPALSLDLFLHRLSIDNPVLDIITEKTMRAGKTFTEPRWVFQKL